MLKSRLILVNFLTMPYKLRKHFFLNSLLQRGEKREQENYLFHVGCLRLIDSVS
jgi:hypothetical protein